MIDLKLDTKKPRLRISLSPFTADSASKLDVLGHDGDPLGVNSAQVGVLEETHQVGLRRLLQRCHGGALEPEVRLEVLGDFPDQSLEGQLSDQQLGALLVLSNLPQGHSPRPESVRLLDPSGRGRRFPRRLGRQLLPRRLPSGGLPCRLLVQDFEKQISHQSAPRFPVKPFMPAPEHLEATSNGCPSKRIGANYTVNLLSGHKSRVSPLDFFTFTTRNDGVTAKMSAAMPSFSRDRGWLVAMTRDRG
ncbi:hypothetical protein RJ639_047571 [Escallonia herrerae]|uniref:Uncharacterized protein n=1 Tax=Escallonia herrerae TaxID=1293975 RepID=A0AA89B0B1_9ASTE|nr:hypothetical protein RJ639_047571 [Escallonia herrerae]